jgi:mRNA interferase RelE/StbE
MTYELKFLHAALKEWQKIAPPIREQFKKKLAERLINPHVPSAKLSGYDSVYKIKLRAAGYRLAYEVMDDELVVLVLAVGKRDKDAIYRKLNERA